MLSIYTILFGEIYFQQKIRANEFFYAAFLLFYRVNPAFVLGSSVVCHLVESAFATGLGRRLPGTTLSASLTTPVFACTKKTSVCVLAAESAGAMSEGNNGKKSEGFVCLLGRIKGTAVRPIRARPRRAEPPARHTLPDERRLRPLPRFRLGVVAKPNLASIPHVWPKKLNPRESAKKQVHFRIFV